MSDLRRYVVEYFPTDNHPPGTEPYHAVEVAHTAEDALFQVRLRLGRKCHVRRVRPAFPYELKDSPERSSGSDL